MVRGGLIMESLRRGTTLGDIGLMVRSIRRLAPEVITSDQPDTWTLLEFETGDANAERLAHLLADILDEPGWYADFHSDDETFVVFSGRVFRYPRGDRAGRAAAERYARSMGVPEAQLDWPA